MAPSTTALALFVALLLAWRTDGKSLLPTPPWSLAPHSLCPSPTASGRLLRCPPHLRSQHRAGDQNGGRHAGQAATGAAAVWSCRSDTFAGWSALRLAVPTGSCLLGAVHSQGSLLTAHFSLLVGSLKAVFVSPQASALLISTSADHGALYCGEMPWLLARCQPSSQGTGTA